MKPFNTLVLCLFAPSFLLLAACSKPDDPAVPGNNGDFHCDNAQLCVKNIGQDTIRYAWGSNWHDKKIGPGESACTYVGEVYKETSGGYESTSYPVEYFDSDHGSYAIEVNECLELKEIE